MSLASAFAGIAAGVSSAVGGPYADALVLSRGQPEYDEGGDVVPNTGGPSQRGCKVQFTSCTEAMVQADGYTAKDMRLLILAGTLNGGVGTEDRIKVDTGHYAGVWLVQSVDRDSAGIGWELRGRRA